MIKNVSIIYELKREKSNVIEALRKYLKEKNINFLFCIYPDFTVFFNRTFQIFRIEVI